MSFHKGLCLALALAALLAWPATAQATILQFQANVDGLQETPANASPASGFASISLDDTTNTVTVLSANYVGLVAPSTAVHIHDAVPGVPGPVILALVLDAPGSTAGTVSGGGVITAGQVADMIAGNTYINVHSQVFPGGEIRGQFFQVPEPAGVVLLALGAITVAVVTRRRRRAA